MKKILSVVLLAALNVFVLADSHKAIKLDKSVEDGTTQTDGIQGQIYYGRSVALDTSRRVPGLVSWWDYWTNGQNQRLVSVLGDTVLICTSYTDSANARVSNGRVLYYQISYDGGLTWEADPVLVQALPGGGAYPDIHPVFVSGNRTVAISGRNFQPGSRGFVGVDVLLGAGAFTNTTIPAVGADYFTCMLSSTELGGVYQSGDTLFFRKFNYTNNTYGTRQVIAMPTAEIDANGRKCVASSTNGQNVFAMWYVSTAGVEKLAGKLSTDGGSTWGAMQTVMPTTYTVGGDVTTPWFGMDVTYKPNSTTVSAAWCTQPDGSVRGYKILYWSPGINGGNPVKVADWTNMPVLGDTAWVFNSTALIQVGMTYISHPTLAYSSDGTRLFCSFNSTQKDSVVYPDNSVYLYNDVYICYSDNDGATWSTPKKVASCTVDGDEIYPSLSKTGNTPGNVGLVYQLSGFPGSSSFSQTTAPVSKNWLIYTRVDPVTGGSLTIGVNTISTTVPDAFSLEQNYPNPFNPSTKIRFNVKSASNINIKVFDITGREVVQLVKNEFIKAGTHEVTFDASKYASGVYFYSLEANNVKLTKKMMLVK
jgi:Secretion system C-terminal sorting domain